MTSLPTRAASWFLRLAAIWQAVGRCIAQVIVWVLLAAVYVLVLTPTGWIRRTWRPDSLDSRWESDGNKSGWQTIETPMSHTIDHNTKSGMISGEGLAAELLTFLRENKKWWLIPLLASLALVAIVSVFSATPAAPFIYTLF
ncbi:MAG: DUF5989 family protein [Planctomycetota bacterium]